MSNAKRRHRRRRRLNANARKYTVQYECTVRYGLLEREGRWRDSYVIWMDGPEPELDDEP